MFFSSNATDKVLILKAAETFIFSEKERKGDFTGGKMFLDCSRVRSKAPHYFSFNLSDFCLSVCREISWRSPANPARSCRIFESVRRLRNPNWDESVRLQWRTLECDVSGPLTQAVNVENELHCFRLSHWRKRKKRYFIGNCFEERLEQGSSLIWWRQRRNLSCQWTYHLSGPSSKLSARGLPFLNFWSSILLRLPQKKEDWRQTWFWNIWFCKTEWRGLLRGGTKMSTHSIKSNGSDTLSGWYFKDEALQPRWCWYSSHRERD